MNEFPPPRQPGITVLVVLILFCLSLIAIAVWQMNEVSAGGERFVVALLLALAGLLPLPWLAYHLYALQNAVYLLDRDKLTLRWGLRLEQIPIADVEWVRPAGAQTHAPHPPLHLPGLILGRRRHAPWGEVEFLASNAQNLLFVGSARRVYAISPANASAFLTAFRRVLESGSLIAAPAQSVYPSFVVAQAWHSPWARFCWTAAFLVNLGLLLWTGWLMASLPRVSLGFLPNLQPAEPVPGEYLLLLPVISLFFLFAGWVAGLFLYRRAEQRPLAHTLWLGNLVGSSFFLLALYFTVS